MQGYYLTVFLLLPNVSLAFGSGKIVSGEIKSRKNWEPVVQFFSFIDGNGTLSYKVKYTVTNQCCPSLGCYNEDSWKTVRSKENMDCLSKISRADAVITFQNVSANNNTHNFEIQCFTDNSSSVRQCSGTIRLSSVDKKWWSFTISHCNSTQGLSIYYEFTFTRGYIWEEEKESKEKWTHITGIHLVAFVISLFMFVTSLYCARWLLRMNKFHPAYKLFMISVSCEFGGLLYDTTYILFETTISPITDVLHVLSEFLLQVLLVLIAFGWTITQARLSERLLPLLRVFFFVSAVIYVIHLLLVFEIFPFDRAMSSVQFFQFSRILRILKPAWRVLTWALFSYGAYSTIRQNPERKNFYLAFVSSYTIWFIAPLLSSLLFYGLNLYVSLLGYFGLFYIMWPSQVNRNFPLHNGRNEVQPRPGVNLFSNQEVPPGSDFQQSNIYAPRVLYTPGTSGGTEEANARIF
ncbi:transmembrane protein 145-like [Montipora capricornis]|uniref:transmembrane protein 145-like n=1 Tax=Montipora foliosa TaxID=591990 RepID=UPI0035F1D4F7